MEMMKLIDKNNPIIPIITQTWADKHYRIHPYYATARWQHCITTRGADQLWRARLLALLSIVPFRLFRVNWF